MLSILLALSMTGNLPAPGGADFDARIRESIAAAESLQGPLDGRWTLVVQGRPEYVFQISDPANGARAQAAWRDWGQDPASPLGAVDNIVVRGRSLTLAFSRPGATSRTTISLHHDRRVGWRGEIVEEGRRADAVLHRN